MALMLGQGHKLSTRRCSLAGAARPNGLFVVLELRQAADRIAMSLGSCAQGSSNGRVDFLVRGPRFQERSRMVAPIPFFDDDCLESAASTT